MAGRDRTKGNTRSAKALRQRVIGLGTGAGGFLAAAAMATGSMVTAAPAKADFDDLIDLIIQPLATHVADSLSGIDPSAAADVTSLTDSLSSLSSFDPAAALSSAAEPASSVTSSSADLTTGSVPITVEEGTEPAVQATVDGSNTTLLVDTGSGGLVVPWQDLGSTHLEALRALHESGAHLEKIGHSGYSGGVDYTYREYDDVPVSYGNGAIPTTNTPVDVVMHSHGTSIDGPKNFEAFLKDNDVTGILGIGDNTAGPTESPLEAVGYTGVTVDLDPKSANYDELVFGSNAGTPIDTVSGAPITNLYETVTTAGTTNGSTVSDDVDSGGVYGTIPSSLDSHLEPGSTITVYSSQGGTELYSYTVTADNAPTPVSGTSIDSGVEPYFQEPIYINYSDDTLTFDEPSS